MRIGAPVETAAGERRVALVPETVARLVKAGHQIHIQSGAGDAASYADEAYKKAGATLEESFARVAETVEVLVRVQPPSANELESLRVGTVLIGLLNARRSPDLVGALASRSVTAFSMELVPRIARAQGLDVLSSQASLAGYKAVLIAADTLPKYMPMMMTAAGTIPPARVVVLGAGVAGLQAIATARRLGAVVEAYDVRPVVREQVQSLGAKFIELDGAQVAEGSGGYAGAQSDDEQARLRASLRPFLAAADAVITTAAIPGKRAPLLIDEATVASMKHGSVIVDLAAESGGNCELTQPGETVIANGVSIHGPLNIPSSLAVHASQLYSRNVAGLLDLLLDSEGKLKLNFEDEIVSAMCVTHDGQVRQAAGGTQ